MNWYDEDEGIIWLAFMRFRIRFMIYFWIAEDSVGLMAPFIIRSANFGAPIRD